MQTAAVPASSASQSPPPPVMTTTCHGRCARLEELKACLLALRADLAQLREQRRQHHGRLEKVLEAASHWVGLHPSAPAESVQPEAEIRLADVPQKGSSSGGRCELHPRGTQMEALTSEPAEVPHELTPRMNGSHCRERTPTPEPRCSGEVTPPRERTPRRAESLEQTQPLELIPRPETRVRPEELTLREMRPSSAQDVSDAETDPEMPLLEPSSPPDPNQKGWWEAARPERHSFGSSSSSSGQCEEARCSLEEADLGACWGRGALRDALKGINLKGAPEAAKVSSEPVGLTLDQEHPR